MQRRCCRYFLATTAVAGFEYSYLVTLGAAVTAHLATACAVAGAESSSGFDSQPARKHCFIDGCYHRQDWPALSTLASLNLAHCRAAGHLPSSNEGLFTG